MTAPDAHPTAEPAAAPAHPKAALGRWTADLAIYGPAAATREALCLWASGCGAWSDYIHRLASARSPTAVLEAGAQLLTDSVDLCGRTAAVRLHDAGVRAPLLNDA